MTSYIGILEKEPGTLWGIWFPDLPGCIAAAPTSDEVIAQVGPALTQWAEEARIDGELLPPPRSIEKLREDKNFSVALARGDVPIIVPVQSLDLEEDVLKIVDEAAEERGLTRLDFIRQAVMEKAAG